MKEKSNSKRINTRILLKLSLLILTLLPLRLFSQQSYDSTFRIRDIYDTKVVIKSYYGKDVIIIDTLKQREDGTFRLLKDNINKGMPA